ncbi:hypothetical protein LSUE1_G005643 [Lachnellula suecica]|uniref:Riboflavin kinase n=1 Tax=Lachnellula suecica TaxID=602035 RepID=A0A8T9C709_9HELO|nr:hypothetical protein LSUE1_G005643 [Lachnellula suecica]
MKHFRSFKGGRDEPNTDPQKEEAAMETPDLITRPELSLKTTIPPRLTKSEIYGRPQSTGIPNSYGLGPGFGFFSVADSVPPTAASSPYTELAPSSVSTPTKSNTVQNAFREVRHFAGGLVSHPYETNKHFTMLRHSHGLVFYQGSSTSLAISIFSDAPLPSNCTFWLQSKGYSGTTGMRLKAFVGANGSWLNVTPSIGLTPEQLNPSDERAWQRDIVRFRKKAKPVKIREKHQLRQTVILRVPAEAGDGYFSVVFCIGDKKKTLCTSPTFRLMSTSTSMHCIRGASALTLPLELGAMAVNVYATSKIALVAGPVAAAVQKRAQQFMPSTITTAAIKGAGTKAYDMAGGKEKVHALVAGGNSQYEQQLSDYYIPANTINIALEEGPQPPYPIRFTCTSEPFPKNNTDCSEYPTTVLNLVPDGVSHQLHGHYFALVRIPKESDEWQQALITALPPDPTQLARANFALANKRTIKLRLIDGYAESDTDSDASLPTKLNILILGFLRPDEPIQRANIKRGMDAGDLAASIASRETEQKDVLAALEVLDHPAWAPELVESGNSGLSVKKGYADARMGVQRQVDKVPLHLLGVRTESDKMKDRNVLVGGFYVLR